MRLGLALAVTVAVQQLLLLGGAAGNEAAVVDGIGAQGVVIDAAAAAAAAAAVSKGDGDAGEDAGSAVPQNATSTIAETPAETPEALAIKAKAQAQKQKQEALAEGQRLREEARKQAQARRSGAAGADGAPKKPDAVSGAGASAATKAAKAAAARAALSKPERRELEKLERKRERQRTLNDLAEKQRKAAQEASKTVHGRRRLQEEASRPSCSNGRTDGLESDEDCGGEVCRKELYQFEGQELSRLCRAAQKCHVGRDCVGGTCVAGRCAARLPFQVASDEDLFLNMHLAYFQVLEERGRADEGFFFSEDVDRFVELAMNPDGSEKAMESPYKDLFDREVPRFKKQQGLLQPGVEIKYGFVMRGACMQFAKDLVAKAARLFTREL